MIIPFAKVIVELACESAKQLFSLLTWKNETLEILDFKMIFFYNIALSIVSGFPLIKLLMVFLESPTMCNCCSCSPLANWIPLRRAYSSA
jgi:hypothetical protein